MPTLYLLAHVPTDAVNEGFLPAACRLGLDVILVTDQVEQHLHYFSSPDLPAYPREIIACDVFNPISVIAEIGRHPSQPAAIFSNSDHLQTSAALAAEYFGLPGKDWKVTYRTKNKAAMRTYLHERHVDILWHTVVTNADELAGLSDVPYPCVAKPREGVGSRLVRFCEDSHALAAHCREVWRIDPSRAVLIEEYMAGELYSLETLGDGTDIVVLGGFQVALSPPPDFVELEGRWGDWLTVDEKEAILHQIRSIGVGFGSCHTEFVLTPKGPRIVEINYRTVGDHMEFMLEHTLDFPLFEKIIRLYMGEPLGRCSLANKVAAIRYFPTDRAGTINSAPAGFLRMEDGVRIEYRSLRKSGDRVAITRSNKDYLGVLSVSAGTSPMLDTALEAASSRLEWDIAPDL